MQKLMWIYLVLIIAPMTANATTSSDAPGVTTGSGSVIEPYIINLGVTTQTMIADPSEEIDDLWSVELATAGVLNVTFAAQMIDVLSIGIPDFETAFLGMVPPLSNSDGIYSLNLAAGVYQFGVVGTADTGTQGVGGIYSVTSSFSAIPLPASLWLLSTALIGMMLSRNRKSA